MSRKHNPLVALVALILMILLVLACTGCEEAEAAEAAEPTRFKIEAATKEGGTVDHHLYIITDTETGVQYLYVDDYRAGGLTVLQPAPDREEANQCNTP